MTHNNKNSAGLPPEYKDTHIGRASQELGAFRWAWQQHRVFALLTIILVVGGFTYLIKVNLSISADNTELKQRLAPFEAIAAKSFPNQQDRDRLDSLIDSIQELNTKYGSFALKRSDETELKQVASEFYRTFQNKFTNSPAITLHVYYAASDSSRRFAEQLRTIFRDCQWDVSVETGEVMKWPLDRGLWIGRFSDEPRNPEIFLFCVNTFTSFGLDLKLLKFVDPSQDDSRLHLIVNDPKYLR